ncbi:hypothetical protein C8R47DRAFT_1196373 [Mycena vitilis]|nr:hypothetical protein C8R47DRAFT_1204641 [Mycena vitilis]KAJ6487361.1 hypothetical protein C8R47DRAFT_1196373 [Mycena vitilis]
MALLQNSGPSLISTRDKLCQPPTLRYRNTNQSKPAIRLRKRIKRTPRSATKRHYRLEENVTWFNLVFQPHHPIPPKYSVHSWSG